MTYHYGLTKTPRETFYQLASTATLIGVDTETVSLSNRTLLGIGISFNPHDAYYVTEESNEFEIVLEILRRKRIRKIYHNAPFDLRVLRKYNVDIDDVEETALMARLAMADSAVLEDLSFWLEPYGSKQTQSASALIAEYKGHTMADLPTDVVAKKCCQDACAALLLFKKYSQEIDMKYYERLRRLIGPLERISRQGIKLDQTVLNVLNTEYSREEVRLRALFRRIGFNVSSLFETGYTLSERGNALPFLPRSKLLATDSANLRKLDDPLVVPILRWREISKKLSTYILPWIGEDRAYTTLRMEAATGRVNSTNAGELEKDRNLQNIPKVTDIGKSVTIRSAFIPDNG